MKEKVKRFLKENKKDLIIGTSCIVAGGVTLAIALSTGKKHFGLANQLSTCTKEEIIKFLQEANSSIKYVIF